MNKETNAALVLYFYIYNEYESDKETNAALVLYFYIYNEYESDMDKETNAALVLYFYSVKCFKMFVQKAILNYNKNQ